MPEKKGFCFESGVAIHLEKFQTVANYTKYIRIFQRHFFREFFFMNVNKAFLWNLTTVHCSVLYLNEWHY